MSPAFPAQTDVWVSFWLYANTSNFALRWFSLMSGGAERIALKSKTSNVSAVDVVLTDGTTDTVIGSFNLTTGIGQKIDIHAVYGAAGSVTVHKDGVQVLTWTGDTTRGGSTTLDGFQFGREYTAYYFSEFIVANEDTRLFSLRTLAPSGAGDANAWTGAYGTVNEVTLDDATIAYTDTPGLDAQFALADLPAGTFTIKAVAISARASHSAGATSTALKLGVKTNGTVDSGTSQSTDTAWATVRRLMTQNPVTSNIWQPSEINALQLNLRSA